MPPNCCPKLAHLKAVIRFLLVGFAIVMPIHSLSATTEETPEELIVNATRVSKQAFNVPAAIGVVDRQTVQLAQQQLGLDESLVRVPGIFLQNRFNFAQDLRVAIRGSGARGSFGVRGVKILVDGIPNTLPDGQGQIDSIDIGSVGQVDVLRGASSALYGNASGGVINIASEAAPAKPYLEARTAFGEYGYAKSQVKSAGRSGKLDYLMSASYLELDGYRDQSTMRNNNFNSRFLYRIDDSSDVTLVANLFDSPVSDDPGGISAAAVAENPKQARDLNVLFDAGESIEQQKLGLKYRKSFGDTQEVIARGYSLWRDFSGKLPFAGGGVVEFDRRFYGGGLQYIHSAPLSGLDNRLTLGVDIDRQEDDRRRFDNDLGSRGALVFDQLEEVTSVGVFVQDELLLNERVEATLGLRYDEVSFDVDDKFLTDGDDSGDRDLDALSASLGLLWRLNSQFNLYANIGSSFETPTTTEFANPAGGGFNQSLDPQELVSYEIGIKGVTQDNRASYDLALFAIDVEDELTPFELAHSPGRTFFENAGESTRRGVELAVSARLGAGFDASFAYTYSDFEFDRFNDANGNRYDGKRIPGIPEHLAHGSLGYRHPKGFFATAELLFVDGFYANNANSAKTDSYSVANLRLGWKVTLERLELTPFIGLNNLTDEDYAANVRINAFGGRYFEPAPQRNIYGGLSVRLNL